MLFYSTHGQCRQATLEEAVMAGLAPDGGLYMPERIPVIPRAFFNNIGEMSVGDIAYVVATTMLGDDIDAAELKNIVFDTFSFDIPLIEIEDGIFALELFHGPTLAFKDVGARFLARIISHYSRPHNKDVNVLVATSGDSGGAVGEGFHKVPGVKVFVLYPENYLSPVQLRQFSSLGDNVYPIEVKGNFDDCQRLVKKAFVDSELRNAMRITSANSINICRLLPQMFYYFYAYSQYLHRDSSHNDGVTISVPCGNLGNLTAGLLAKRMGLPVRKFVVANNVNDSFTKYLVSGLFTPTKPVRTIACAMDVGNPSNLSRILDLYDNDYDAIKADMTGHSFSDEEIGQTMADVRKTIGYVLDPHSATAYMALKREISPDDKGIFLATAHPAKFAATVNRITGADIREPKTCRAATADGHSIVRIPPSLTALKKVLFLKA